jgi:hypothetical protein
MWRDKTEMNASQRINQTSGNCEWYTSKEIIESARNTMSGIDLDPASSGTANRWIKARLFYEHSGLEHSWFGKVWLNHPFGRKENRLWIEKLLTEFRAGRVTQACCITYACTSEKWFQPLLLFPQCFLCPRTNYILPSGDVKRGVTKGSVVTYLGPEVENFNLYFSKFGVVKDFIFPEGE